MQHTISHENFCNRWLKSQKLTDAYAGLWLFLLSNYKAENKSSVINVCLTGTELEIFQIWEIPAFHFLFVQILKQD